IDMAAFYQTVTSQQQPLLMKARQAAKDGQQHLAESDFKAAFGSYQEARGIFESVGDEPEARSADYWMNICIAQDINPQDAQPRFLKLCDLCQERGYKWLTVRSLNGIVNYNLALNEYSIAINYGNR